MTRNSKAAFGFCLLSVVLFTCVASAQLVFSGVGSSAMLDTFAVAAFTQVCSARVGSDCHHWSAGGKNSNDNQYWAQAVDSRNSGIPVEPGTVFIAWDNNTNPIRVWSYLSVDSAVGQRLFFANPRATLQLDGGVLTVPGQNQVPAAILLNRQTGFTQSDGTTGIPTAVLTAVQTQFTAAVTDVRPEDAKYATNRVLTTYNVNGNGLGYNTAGASCFQPPDSWTVTGNLGCPIYDNWGGRSVPVQFSLPGGTDPYTLTKVPPATSIPVGAAPIIFLYNSSNSAGLGATSGGVPILRDISFSNASQVWNGAQGGAAFLNPALANVPITIFLNEPLSGAMNTAEFSSFRTFLAPKFAVPTNSQEKG